MMKSAYKEMGSLPLDAQSQQSNSNNLNGNHFPCEQF